MNMGEKDWFKFALELYEKSKGMGFVNNWGKEDLEPLMEMFNKLNLTYPSPAQPAKEVKIQQGAEPVESAKTEKAEDNVIWQQDPGPPHDSAFASGERKGGYVPPISIFETAKEVNVHVILPGIASKDDLDLNLSHEAIELYGTKVAGGVKGSENFYRMIRLPAPVEPSGVIATYRNGFLYISAPKRDRMSSRKILVKFE